MYLRTARIFAQYGNETLPLKLHLISDIIQSQALTVLKCQKLQNAVNRRPKISAEICDIFGHVHALSTCIGRRRSMTPPMLEALYDHLLEKSGLYLEEITIFLWDEFRMLASTSSIRRALVY
jgi:hypothetical protein